MPEATVYCPYTDRRIPVEHASREHIIPLALGGMDGFEILVDSRFNSRVGSRIDGKMANDSLMTFERNRLDVRGHSNKRPVPVFHRSHVRDADLPVQAHFDREAGLRLYSPRHGRFLSEEEQAGQTVESRFQMESLTRIRFVAKVGLAAGYLCYGEQFVQNVQHSDLRNLMNHGREAVSLCSAEMLVSDEFMKPASTEEKILRAACAGFGRAVVVLIPSGDQLTVAVGCLHQFIGLTVVPSDTQQFPNEGVYTWGQVICVQDGRLKRASFRQALEEMQQRIGEGETPDSTSEPA